MKIRGTTRLTGVFGWPVAHSLSPVFQNAAYRECGLDWMYLPLPVSPEDLEKAVGAIRVFGFAGVNVTIPHKEAVVRFLDELDEPAAAIGAVNTIVVRDGRTKGYTTDGRGFLRSLMEDGGFCPEGKRILLFGAGGAALSLGAALVNAKAGSLLLCNRTDERAKRLAKRLAERPGGCSVRTLAFGERNDPAVWRESDLVVNATSVGLDAGDEIELAVERNIEQRHLVYDIVYNRETLLIRSARLRGARCLNGLSMLVYQGAVSFELWTGVSAPVAVMKKAVGL